MVDNFVQQQGQNQRHQQAKEMILAIEMDSVLPTTFQNVGRASMSRKFFNPTQGEFLKLRRGVKSWNAMTKPNMGR